MPYYHVKILSRTPNSQKTEADGEMDLSEEQVKIVIDQYENKECMFIGGRWVSISDLEHIEIRETPQKTTYYYPHLSVETIFLTASYPNVTRRFIKSPPKNKIQVTPISIMRADSLEEPTEVIVYCTQCGFSQGIFDNEIDMRRKIAVQKKCPECNAVFGFFRDGRIWNLRWETLPSTKYITTGANKSPLEEAKQEVATPVIAEPELNKNVFIVHGRDHEPVKELMAMLNELGFNPIVLHEQASGGLTIAEKLEKYVGKIGYAFILLTPDDIGTSMEGLERAFSNIDRTTNKMRAIQDELAKVFKRRARQNVVLEFGYLMGRLSRERICCLYKGDIELPSDMHGICYVHFNDSVNEVKDMILKELREAGYEIRTCHKN